MRLQFLTGFLVLYLVHIARPVPILGPLLNGAILGLPDLEPFLTDSNTFDYVIVGGGTAGLALAARLSQNSSSTVAVLEAGHDVATDLTSSVLSDTPGGDVIGCGADDSDFAQNKVDWNIHTTPQRGCNNRAVRYARGKTSGGSSARNFMIYQRPSRGSHISWQQLTGDPSWGYDERLDDYKRSITFTPPRQDLRHDRPAVPDTSANYGSDDPSSACVDVSYPNMPQAFSSLLMRAMNRVGYRLAPSFTDGTLDGVQFSAATITPRNGHRSTSRCFYESTMDRKNLKVYFQARAKAIILSKGVQGKPRAQGVTFSVLPGGKGTTNALFASKEVIICAGAFQSPQLLMVSGIGPRGQLDRHAIPRIVINDNVGKNLQDHVFAGPTYKIHPTINTLTRLASDAIYATRQLAEFLQRPPAGILTNHVSDAIGFETLSDDQLNSIGASSLRWSTGDWPHVEAMSAPGLVKDFSNLFIENIKAGIDGSRFVTVLMVLSMPKSTGTVSIRSKDMADLPVVDPAWLTDPVDQRVAIWAYKRARQFFQQEPLRSLLAGNGTTEYYPGFHVQSDEDILDVYRDTAMTVWHAACTCSMQRQSTGGVLDKRLRVYGVDGLRVVDASSFPKLLPGHPTSVIYMLAERAATLIRQDNP